MVGPSSVSTNAGGALQRGVIDATRDVALVTGAAGFIGSTLAERLVADGRSVRGVDSFTDYYEPATKRSNISGFEHSPNFELFEGDLLDLDIDALLDGVDVVYHLAAQPGVRASWDQGFATYLDSNVLVTQRLLEGVRRAASGIRVVYSSSSSVYGDAQTYPTTEDAATSPVSPYGVTKLAGEQLGAVYATNFGVDIVMLRYFTVYGPRQRPDMAIHRLLRAAVDGTTFSLFGGHQIRDFTYVGDIVAANMAAGAASIAPGTVFNVCGGDSTSMHELIAMVEEVSGRTLSINATDVKPGDANRTGGDNTRLRELLGWEPACGLREGITRQLEWHEEHAALASGAA